MRLSGSSSLSPGKATHSFTHRETRIAQPMIVKSVSRTLTCKFKTNLFVIWVLLGTVATAPQFIKTL